MDFSTIKVTSKKVSGNNVDFLTSKITPKKTLKNNVDFSTIEITLKKGRGNDSEIPAKQFVEMTWKFVEIWFSTYRCNIDIESTSIRRGVLVGK